MRENRKQVRVRPHPHHPVDVQVIGQNFMENLHAKDISVGGIGVEVGHLFDGCNINSQVDLVLKLPQEKPFMARGQIRHMKVQGQAGMFGIQFTEISKEDSARVQKYVEARAKTSGTL